MQLREVKIFNSIMPQQMAEFQKKDSQLSLVYEKVLSNLKPPGCQRYTVLGQNLFIGYFYSLIDLH